MTSARVSKVLFGLLAVIAAAVLSTGNSWATPGTCETLPGGVIELESTGGAVGPTGYATLGAALADVNNGSYTGVITIDVCGDTTEAASAVLNASGTGGSSYTGVTISPAGGATRTISGSIAGALIDLNGAGSVVIDGLNSGGNALTIDNASTAAAAATIRFVGDASGDTVRNSTIKGATTGLASGTIVFGAGTTTGNLNDTITLNTITSSGANLPVNAIYSAGNSTSIANTGIVITNNSISDYFSATLASNGILVASNSSAWTITGNKLFQTAIRTATVANTHRAINIITASGSGYTINNNTIGFADAAGAGTTTYAGAVATLYRAIELTAAVSPASSIQGNTVTAISFSTTSASAVAPGIFGGISVLGGSVNVGTTTGNTIGSATTTGAITVTSTVTASLTDGIYVGSPGATVDIRNNNVGGITASSPTATIGFVVRGIETAGAGTNVTMTGNTVGSTTALNSIQVGINPTTTAVTTFVGIQNAVTGTTSVTNNTIQNDSVFGSGASIFQGISNAGAGTHNITGNFVIAGTSRGSGTSQGIVSSTPATTVNINNNVIRGMLWNPLTTSAFRGIEVSGGVTSAVNINDNAFGDATADFITYGTTATGGTLYGANLNGGTAASTLSIQRNDFRRVVHSGTTGSLEVDCFFMNSSAAGSHTIVDNTITNLSVNTSGSVFMVRDSGNPPVGGFQTITNNRIVGAFSKGQQAGQVMGLNLTAGGDVTTVMTQSNNNFSNVTLLGTTSGFCISTQAAGVRVIENNVCNNWVGGAGGTMTGLRLQGFTGGSGSTVRSNTITNFSSAGGVTGIQADGSAGVSILTLNTINTFSTTNGTAIGIVVLTQSLQGNTGNSTVTSNTISGFSTTAGGSPTGISLGSGAGASGTLDVSASLNVVSGLSSSLAGATPIGIVTNTSLRSAKVFRNKVYDIQITGATGTVKGISATAVSSDIYNNLVGDLRAPSATSSGLPNVIGLEAGAQIGSPNAVNFYDNTVQLAGTSSGVPFATAGVYVVSGLPVLKLRNNVVANATIPTGSGRAVALWRNYQPMVGYDISSNNNDLYASTAYYDGVTAYPTMSDMWAAVSPRESASFSENPPFISTVGSSANFLHIVAASATLLESHAVNITGITDDYDAEIRQGNPGYGGTGTAPDVGADEFEGVAVGDIQPPAIVYSLLGAGAPVTSRSLTATITDATGVATIAGVRPRLYFKKSTDANDQTGWKYVEAIGSGNSPFDFTIDYTQLNAGSVSVGDTIQYFVVAQDTVGTPNVGIYQGAFAAAPTSVALTPAAFPIGATINSYPIIASISGALTVCPSGCDYLSLTNPGGLFETLNGRVFTGSVTVDILGDSLAETGLNALNQWPEDPAGNFTLTIRPGGGAARTVSGSFTGGLIRLNGADRVTIDGLNTGGNSLTVSNTSATNLSTTIQLVSTGVLNSGASNNTIRNLNIVGGSICTAPAPPATPVCPAGSTAGTYGIAISGTNVNSAGADNDGNTFSGNTITKVSYGIHAFGASLPASAANNNLVISGNIIGPASLGTDSIGSAGVFIRDAINPTVSGNTIRNISVTTTTERAISLPQGVAGGSIAGNTITNVTSSVNATGNNSIAGIYLGAAVSNVTVSRNRIQSVWSTFATGAGARGILANSEGADVVIANNMISDIYCFAGTNNSGTNWPVGIHVEFAPTVVKVYNNSVNLYGPHTGLAGVTGSAAMLVGGSVSSIDIRDNIFANSYDNTTSTTERTFSINAANVPNTVFATLGGGDINYNDYYVNGPVPANNFVGALNGTNVATLALWKTATGKDGSSIAADPQYVSATDLHINISGGATPVENVGQPIVAVPNDFDGDLRAIPPDIGADEIRCHAVVAGESCNDSNACTVDSCSPATGCSNVAGNAGAVCRGAVGACDVAELCDGTSFECPDNEVAPPFTLCRAATGDCDAEEVCNGFTAACPPDVLQPNTVECRASAGDCDVAESCTGVSATCPADSVEPNTTVCRASGGACDVAESCTGSSAACPADSLEPNTTVCRASAGDCDLAENCAGDNVACPSDTFKANTVECRASAGTCDVAEACTGSTATCPSDGFASITTGCTGSSQDATCDNDGADHCSGSDNSCVDAFQADTVSCTGTSNGGACDGTDHCSGTNNACVDAFQPPTYECRASTATCDPAEFCDGKASVCPADATGVSAPVGPTVSLSKDNALHTTTISWTETIPGPFNVYRGSRTPSTPFSYNQTCFAFEIPGPSTSDMQRPAPGWVFFYLISRSEGTCSESTVGQDSAGADRPNPLVCPMPPPDADADGYPNATDNCPNTYNPSQNDLDHDGRGDVCDNCPSTSNPTQHDTDNDGLGDECDSDPDADAVPAAVDNCPNVANADQADSDRDGVGDACQ